MKLKRAMIIASIILMASSSFAIDPTAYVINTSGESLSKINLTTNQVTNDLLTLGTDIYCYPNQIIVRDTMAYVVLSGTAEIQIINLNTETTVDWIFFPPGSNPFWMAFSSDNFLYTTLMVNNALTKIDLSTDKIVHTEEIGISPEGIIVYDKKAYVAITAYDFDTYTFGQGRVVVYDTEADTIMTDFNIEVGVNPQFLTVDNQGFIHCVCTGDYWSTRGSVYRINPETNSIIDYKEVGGDPSLISISPENIAFISAGGWVDDGEVFSYNSINFDIYHDSQNPIYVDSGAMGIVTFEDSTAFACTFGDRIFRINSQGETIHTYSMGDGPIHLDFDYLPGDANGDWNVDVGDAVYLINYTFKFGAPPPDPRWRANVNADDNINVGDAVYLINYIFKGGERPGIGSIWVR